MDEERKASTSPPSETAGQPDDLQGLQEHQQAWEGFAACAVRLIPVLKAQMAAVTDETERSAMEIMAHLRLLASSDVAVTDEARSASLTKIVMAMQFQDITRQKLEHVGQALDQWRSHMQALLAGPKDLCAKRHIAALEKIEHIYTIEEERRLHAEALTPDYQEPVPMDNAANQARDSDSVTLF